MLLEETKKREKKREERRWGEWDKNRETRKIRDQLETKSEKQGTMGHEREEVRREEERLDERGKEGEVRWDEKKQK